MVNLASNSDPLTPNLVPVDPNMDFFFQEVILSGHFVIDAF